MKRPLFSLLILIFLFLMLETSLRAIQAYRIKSIAPFFYGASKYYKLLKKHIPQESFFRPPFIVPEDRKKKIFLFIGSSVTYSCFSDDFHTFPYLLQSKIKGVLCFNAGRPGANSKEYLDVLIQCCRNFFIPELVIFYVGFNDIYWMAPFQNKIVDRFARYSFLVCSVKEKLIKLNLNKKAANFEYLLYFVKEFEKNIELCIKFAQSKNIRVVLIPEVLVSEKFGPYKDYRSYRKLYLEIPEVLKNLAKKYNCHFLDPKDILYADWRNNFVDCVHLTDRGNEVFSTFLADNLPLKKK